MIRFVVAVMAGLALLGGSAHAGDKMLARQLTDRGIELQLKGEHAQAVRLFDAALVETDHPKIRYFRAKSLIALQRFDEAEAELLKIQDMPEVSKYRPEIIAFFNEIKGEQERQKLAASLEAERQARALAEAQRRAAEQKSDETAIEILRRKRSGLMPTSEMRAEDGPLMKRILPLVPSFHEPIGEYDGKLLGAAYMHALDKYDTELTAAKVLSVLAVVGVAVGVGVGTNPLSDVSPADGARQVGLAVGVVGVVSGLAAAVLWPSPPVDPRARVVHDAQAVGLR
ncbi:MAG: CDC27 family protein [Myxococcota bacterium]